MSGFSFKNFVKYINSYLPEYYAPAKAEKFNDKKSAVEYVNEFMQRKESDRQFETPVFLFHCKEWLEAGRPDGAEYMKMQSKWIEYDNAHDIDYYVENDNWEKKLC